MPSRSSPPTSSRPGPRPRDWIWVGLLAGIGVLFEYPAASPASSSSSTPRSGGRGGGACGRSPARIPAAIVLGGYDWLAFGAPWRLSYHYTDNMFTPQQQQDLFGVGIPTPHGIWTLLIDGHGLLLVSPVLAIAVAGLVRFWHRQRLEAAVAGGDRGALPALHGRLLPAERRAVARAAVRRRRRFRSCCSGCRSRSFAGAMPPGLWPRSRSGSALFDELTWSVANKLDFLAWPETVWSLLGTSRREGSLILLTTGAAAAIVAGAGVIGKRFRERPIGVLKSSAPEPL